MRHQIPVGGSWAWHVALAKALLVLQSGAPFSRQATRPRDQRQAAVELTSSLSTQSTS